jgi:hypothetical protein
MFSEVNKTVQLGWLQCGCSVGNTGRFEMASNTKFHKDFFGHSGNIKVNTWTILEALVLILIMWMIYDVCCWNDFRWHDKYMSNFMTIGSGIRVILKVLPHKFEKLQCWYYWWWIYNIRHWDAFLPSSMKKGTGVQTILTFGLSNFKGCNTILINRYLMKDERKFREFFRLNVRQFNYVLKLVEDKIRRQSCNRVSHPITPAEKLAVTLRQM